MNACPYCAQENVDAATVCNHGDRWLQGISPARDSRWVWRAAVTLTGGILVATIGILGSGHLRAKSSHRTPGAPPERPLRVTEVVENLPADSWTAIPLNLPYSGVLQVQIGVRRGNALNVFVTAPDELQAMHGDQVATVRQFPGFGATTTKAFRGEGRLAAGNYYLVLHDPSFGMPASRGSNVSVRADLRP